MKRLFFLSTAARVSLDQETLNSFKEVLINGRKFYVFETPLENGEVQWESLDFASKIQKYCVGIYDTE